MRTVSILTLGLLVLSGCPGDDTGTTVADTGADSTTVAGDTTESADTNPPGTTEVASESATGTTADPDTTEGLTTMVDPDTTTDPGTTTEPGTTDDTTTGMGGVCDPDAMDDECATCVKESCCPELEACSMDADCTCFQECAAMNPGIPGALMCADAEHCDISLLDLMNDGTIVGALATCTQQDCPVCVM